MKTDLLKLSILIAAGLTAAALYSSFKRNDVAPTSSIQKESIIVSQASAVSPNLNEQKPQDNSPVIQIQSAEPNAKTNTMPKDFAYQTEVQELIKLQAKIFMSEDEKTLKENLLKNEEFLRGLRPLFSVTGDLGSELSLAQNVAIDALINSETDAANEVLESIVVDATIENNQLQMENRQQLAELKAEVLYLWSASDPEARERIPNMLPGSVSQKIWQNVIEAQQQNRAESLISAR